jgi:hypothetical protein
MEPTIVLTIFGEIRAWILGIDQAQLEHDKESKIALKSIYTALAETKSYFADRKFESRNRDRERQISKLWFEASVELKSIDQDLAMRCFLKGDYWTDPQNWDEKGELHISLNEMTIRSKQLLTT